MNRPLSYLSDSSLDNLLSIALRVAARRLYRRPREAKDDDLFDQRPRGAPWVIHGLVDEYVQRWTRPRVRNPNRPTAKEVVTQ